jgi:hypothetical protein
MIPRSDGSERVNAFPRGPAKHDSPGGGSGRSRPEDRIRILRMRLNVSTKIAYSELVIIAVIYSTLIPYILICMDFSPIQMFHYIVVTMMILTPLGISFNCLTFLRFVQ